MRLLVINPNSDELMTRCVAETLATVADPATELEVVTAQGGPLEIASDLDAARCVPGVLSTIDAANRSDIDGSVIACFSDPGISAARVLSRTPVVGIREASPTIARNFGFPVVILATGFGPQPHRPIAEERKLLGDLFGGIESLDVGVSESVWMQRRALERVIAVGSSVLQSQGQVTFVLGCAGLGPIAQDATKALGVPVVDPTAAGIKVLEAMVGLGPFQAMLR